jgi:release factor glutamine methyltransferase
MRISEILGISSKKIGLFEARLLLVHVSKHSLEYIIGHPDDFMDDHILEQYDVLVARRYALEPIAYITERKEFYSREFYVTSDVLIPRNDSETLIEGIIENNKNLYGGKILELGVGSGCLLITLLLELENSTGTGVDISTHALAVAAINAQNLCVSDRCKFIQSDWFENVDGVYDVIISNPPYIHQNEEHLVAKETLKYEPSLALFGEFEAYILIANSADKFLVPNGKIYVEIGVGHENMIIDIFMSNGYQCIGQYSDIESRIRALGFTKKE